MGQLVSGLVAVVHPHHITTSRPAVETLPGHLSNKSAVIHVQSADHVTPCSRRPTVAVCREDHLFDRPFLPVRLMQPLQRLDDAPLWEEVGGGGGGGD